MLTRTGCCVHKSSIYDTNTTILSKLFNSTFIDVKHIGSCACLKENWQNQHVVIKCDTQAVVSVLNSGKTQDLTLAAIARNTMMYIAQCDIDLQVVHILGVDNKVVDLLYRWYITSHQGKILETFLPNPRWLHLPRDIADIDWSI